ncbi:hypothetical protein VYA_33870 [Vibrio alfacsensis]|nr:hypothetical protein VA249_34770 [Vibrio alfacsensis]BCN26195.1 hypothetical protein VYA_33870 [Vibrio alfacsensis]
MTNPVVNYQTMQQSEASNKSASNSGFIYKDKITGDYIDISFLYECHNCDDPQIEQPITPSITRIFDINDRYAMINMSNSTVKWRDQIYTGNYPMILNKIDGELYPIVYADKPVEYDSNLNHQRPFVGSATSPKVAPQDSLYSIQDPLNNRFSLGEGLYQFDFDGSAFVGKQLLPNSVSVYESDLHVNAEGLIYVGYEDRRGEETETSMYSVIEANGNEVKVGREYYSYYSHWHLQDGRLLAFDNQGSSDKPYNYMNWNGSKFIQEPSEYTNGGYLALTATNTTAPIRSGYEMNDSCIVNKLNENNEWVFVTSDSLADSGYRPYNGQVVTAQETMYCVDYQIAFSGGKTITAFAFNTETKEAFEFDTGIQLPPSGANYGVIPVSNEEVMFYINDNGNITEHYINVKQANYYTKKHHGHITPVGFLTLF